MGVNLDELERLAKKANDDEFNSDTNWIEYQDAASPETMLKLIAELRALRLVASISKDVSESRLDCDTNSLTGEHISGCTKCDLDQALAEWRKLEGRE